MSANINKEHVIDGKKKNGHKNDCTCHICQNMVNKAKRGGYFDDYEKEKEQLFGGSKKKNGHRINCMCPICKNMKNATKKRIKGCKSNKTCANKMSNGHKINCRCPICKNIRKKMNSTKIGGGDLDETSGEIISNEQINKPSTEEGIITEATDTDYNDLDKITTGGNKTRKKHFDRSKRKKTNKKYK